MPNNFLFILIAPQGALHARFTLHPNHTYHPHDVQVERGHPPVRAPHTLTVTATRLPSSVEFRELAALAATRSACVTEDSVAQWNNLLIPF